MKIQLIGKELLSGLYIKAEQNARLREAFDLRTTLEDGSQRMLNALQPGTHVPIHRHWRIRGTGTFIHSLYTNKHNIFPQELLSKCSLN